MHLCPVSLVSGPSLNSEVNATTAGFSVTGSVCPMVFVHRQGILVLMAKCCVFILQIHSQFWPEDAMGRSL